MDAGCFCLGGTRRRRRSSNADSEITVQELERRLRESFTIVVHPPDNTLPSAVTTGNAAASLPPLTGQPNLVAKKLSLTSETPRPYHERLQQFFPNSNMDWNSSISSICSSDRMSDVVFEVTEQADVEESDVLASSGGDCTCDKAANGSNESKMSCQCRANSAKKSSAGGTTALEDIKPLSDDMGFSYDASGRCTVYHIPAHRLVLALQSPVFHAMFYRSNMAEARGVTESMEGAVKSDGSKVKQVVRVEDIAAGPFRSMIRCIYAGPSGAEMHLMSLGCRQLLGVLYAAKKYQLETLRASCLSFLIRNLKYNPAELCKVYPTAKGWDEENLVQVCHEILARHFKVCVSAPEFVQQSPQFVREVFSSDALCVDEIDVFRAAIRWAESQLQKQAVQYTPLGVGLKRLRSSLQCSPALNNSSSNGSSTSVTIIGSEVEQSHGSPSRLRMGSSPNRSPQKARLGSLEGTSEDHHRGLRPSPHPPNRLIQPSMIANALASLSSSALSGSHGERGACGIQALLNRCGLLKLIRFPLMDLNQLFGEVRASGVLSEGELIAIAQRIQGDISVDCGFSTVPRHLSRQEELAGRFSGHRSFAYSHDFDENGVVFWLGNQVYCSTLEQARSGGHQSPLRHNADMPMGVPLEKGFLNPHGSNRLTVTASSVHCMNHSPVVITSRVEQSAFWTRNELHSWVEFDFGDSTLFMPSLYTIRHGFNKPRDGIRNWVLEGSLDHDRYEILCVHHEDAAIGNAPFDSHTWPVRNTTRRFYRYLRLRQIGPSAATEPKFMYQFTIGGVEFYGELLYTL